MSGRIRVTIDSVPLVIQPAAEDVATFAAARRGEQVAPLPATPRDRADGRRSWEVVVGAWRFEAATEPAARAELRDRAARAAAEHHVTARVTLRGVILCAWL